MRANKLLLLFLLTLPLTVFSQMGNTQYKEVISFALDSIIQNDTTNFFISPLIKRETEFLDFHGNSENCKIQHQLLLEILLNGQQSRLDELEIKQLTPESLRNESAKYRIELSTIISYQNIWATILTIKDSNKVGSWTQYSLLFINDELIEQNILEWCAQ